MESPLQHTTPPGQVVNGLVTAAPTIPAPSPGQLTDEQVLAKLHALGVHFVRFSNKKIPFDPRHRTWGLNLDATLRTHADPDLHVGWIPASVKATLVDVDAGDWRRLVEIYPPAYHAPSATPGRRHLVYRDTQARADINGWTAEGCSGDVRSAGPIILYDAPQLLAALDMGLQMVTFPPATFTRLPEGPPDKNRRNPTNPANDGAPTEGNPKPLELTRRGDKVPVTPPLPLSAEESSQPQSLFDRLRHWAYSHVADAGEPEGLA